MRMCEWASLTGTDAGYGAPKSADCQGAPFSAAVQDDQRFARKWQKPAAGFPGRWLSGFPFMDKKDNARS